jgi:hypothetical protein
MLLCQKSYLCKKISVLYDSNGLKTYIYVLFFKTCPCATHIYILLGLCQNPLNVNFFGQFLELPRQFSPDMSSLWTGQIWLARHVWLLARTCLGLRFSAYIRGLIAPLRTLGLFFLFHSISCGSQGLSRRFWVFSSEPLRFLGDLTPLFLKIFKP